jgi:cytochrome b pre-mRNA-processing protein 3
MRLSPFRRSRRDAETIALLYGAIVAQGRSPAFYESYGVPDTISGRFEMIVLHTVLTLARLNRGAVPLRRFGQEVFDRFCGDMDANLREMGVGDLAVPRRMRRIGEAFYGRQSAYEQGLMGAEPGVLPAALARNVLGVPEPTGDAERLASYVREAVQQLAAQDDASLIRGELAFPSP